MNTSESLLQRTSMIVPDDEVGLEVNVERGGVDRLGVKVERGVDRVLDNSIRPKNACF